VQQLFLTQFEAANYLGKRVTTKDGKPVQLELIQDDPRVPSFLMYHYPDPDVKQSDPVDKDKAPRYALGTAIWALDSNTKNEAGGQRVVFSTPLADPKYPDVYITKTYDLAPKAYHLSVAIDIENRGKENVKLRYQLTGSHGMPLEGEWYTPTHRDSLIGVVDERGNVDRDKQDARTISFHGGGEAFPATTSSSGGSSLRYAGVALQFFASVIAVDEVDTETRLAWARPTVESHELPGIIKGIRAEDSGESTLIFETKAGVEGYYLLPRTLQHLQETKLEPGNKAVLSYYDAPNDRKVATWVRPGSTPKEFFDDITVRVNTEPVVVAPGKSVKQRYVLYHGPVKTRLLAQFSGDKAVPSELVAKYADTLKLYTLTDYRSQGFFGWLSQKIMFTDLLIFVTKLMHTLLYWLHFLVGGYGLAIILLTVIVRGAMFPISRKQAQFSIKMQQLAPELKKLQEKYKDDARARTEATMEFYRKHRINPFASCLPLLLQMPVFLGLYFALQESIHFRLAGFLWIDNLAAPDMFLYWSQSIPWISDPDNIGGMLYLGPYLNILPICAVLLMVVQQQMMAPPAIDEQQAMQMKVMKFMMIFIGIMFYKVAAGLALYFIASSLWGVAERKLLPKKTDQPVQPGQALSAKGGAMGKGPWGKGGPGKGGKNKPQLEEEGRGPMARLKKWWADVLKEAKKK
jgi:YidC/Oxa1 family membrane protein insertase